ncbi:uncharacterized protein LOC131056114 [Cryptomeria japonica]|uniref:uncharacterized protein LOC131056114 n=1 Tax=Cryptomeria japonica TaxID=3369 RepID=UPI0027DA7FE7|nr:uncharacterized protein LOC131056114 [Cryptomeria japonica]
MASHLPVIDLSLFGDKENLSDLEGNNELKKLREACQELGFFHVVNHGVDKALIEKMDCASRDMFSLPEEVKKRAIFPTPSAGYSTPTLEVDGKDSMPESMHFPGQSVLLNSLDQVCTKLWPHGNHHFRLLFMDEKEPQNGYKTSKAHTDIGILTILYQDNVWGLQIRTKEGSWIDVKPLKRSFVVNLGNCLQMWSNCRYHSAEHRVVYGGLKQKVDRLSLAFFNIFEKKAKIKAPEELINEEHPKKYNVAKFGDIIAQYVQLGPKQSGSNYFLI